MLKSIQYGNVQRLVGFNHKLPHFYYTKSFRNIFRLKRFPEKVVSIFFFNTICPHFDHLSSGTFFIAFFLDLLFLFLLGLTGLEICIFLYIFHELFLQILMCILHYLYFQQLVHRRLWAVQYEQNFHNLRMHSLDELCLAHENIWGVCCRYRTDLPQSLDLCGLRAILHLPSCFVLYIPSNENVEGKAWHNLSTLVFEPVFHWCSLEPYCL